MSNNLKMSFSEVEDKVRESNNKIQRESNIDKNDITGKCIDLRTNLANLGEQWDTDNGKNTLKTINSILDTLDKQVETAIETLSTLENYELYAEKAKQ